MKQVIVLEPIDVQRLRRGEMLQLTGSLMLSLQATRKPRMNGAAVEVEEGGLTDKQLYQREYRRTHPRKATRKGVNCQACGKTLKGVSGLGPHKRNCPGKVGAP